MLWKKTLAMIVAALVLASGMWPMAASAQASAKVTLEQAIRIAKAAFPDQGWPEDANFTSSYADWDGMPRWQLAWNEQDKSEVRIAVDANNGRILQYNAYKNGQESNLAPLPKLSEAEALDKAKRFLEKLVPLEFAQCRYQPGEPLRPYLRERDWHLSYHFDFQRYAFNIPFNYNGLRVSVNADTGAIISYNYTWTEGAVPTPSKIINADEAAAIAEDAGKMELQYYLPYAKRGEPAEPILVYQAPKLNYLCVNAHTGEIYTPNLIAPRLAGGANMAAKESVADQLSPAEQQEVTLLEGLLSQAQAETKARQIFAINKTYTVQEAHLTANWQYPEQRHWNLSFTENEQENRQNHISVTLDAETGEVYRYYTNLPQENIPSAGTLNWEEAEKIAYAYLEQMNSAKAKLVELVQPEPTPEEPTEKPISYSFSYRRLVNGVPFPQNGFTVTVFAGQEPVVTSYSLNWVEAEFPSAQDSLSLAAAHAQLRETFPFHLEYRVPERGGRPLPAAATEGATAAKNPITLVYTQAPVVSNMFAAKDMQPLDYQGKPVQEEVVTIPTDIAGHFAEADIKFLAKVGILVVPEGGKYLPHAEATVGDWLELLARASGTSVELQTERLLRSQQVNPKQALKREELALYAVRALGYEKIAAMSDIFQLTAPDAALVSKQYIGHVAIAHQLRLLNLQEQNLAPQAIATRGELAATLMQMFRIER